MRKAEELGLWITILALALTLLVTNLTLNNLINEVQETRQACGLEAK